jgi:ring-1,2-phenylacetyl-CoA epoxidase subunit PaaA
MADPNIPTDTSREDELKERVANGFILESKADMTPGYLKAIVTQMLVQGDTELMSAPAYYMAAKDAPTISSRIAVSAVIQDELGHANKEQLVFGRQPNEFKNPYGFDQPLENWAEMAVANGLFDRAGIVLLSDVHQNTSYGPLKRALVKVDKEEYFHLRHGESWMRRLSKAGGEVKEMLQHAVDWMFPTGIEWFGLPDELKRHSEQLEYRLKGKTNDELRQTWMASVVPLCAEVGVEVPAHYNRDTSEFDLEYDLPCEFDPSEKRWLFEESITWEQVWERWRARGPMNERYTEMIQGRGTDLFGGGNGNGCARDPRPGPGRSD